MGLTFGYKGSCNNRGCEALSVSFLEILNEIAKRENRRFKVFLFIPISAKRMFCIVRGKEYLRKCYLIDRVYSNLNLNVLPYWIFKGSPKLLRVARKCDVVFDFTSGDSFTDIYGTKRYYDLTKAKKQLIGMDIPLVLGSQTIGPFKNDDIRDDASKVIKKCKEVFVRDQLSYNCVKEISGRLAKITTDVAFFLPFDKKDNALKDRIVVGFNPSGLLWQGGYNRSNQFGLKFDYKEYCMKVLESVSKDEHYEVILIPHAYSDDMSSIDNDLTPIYALKEKYPKCKAVIDKLDSMEIKTQINKCDVFIGARMHATIAAFSSGIPTIPVAYSRKFSGLYNEYGYSYIIDANRFSLDEAVNKTLDYIENLNTMKKVIEDTRKKINENKERIIEMYSDLLNTI